MAITERLSVSIHKDRAAHIRELVSKGTFDSISSAIDEAADMLIDRERAREEWWTETLRRCDEAEKHPERLLDADTFFQQVRAEIERRKKAMAAE